MIELFVTTNQHVETGDPLFRLDTSRQEAALEQAEVELERMTVYAGTSDRVE